MADYIVQGTLRHDGRTFQHGETFTSDDEALIKRLRHLHALATPAEILPPAAVEEQHAALRDENATLKARLAALEAAAQATPPAPTKGGKGAD